MPVEDPENNANASSDAPLNLRYCTFLPLNKFERSQIVPTEDDTLFRKQLIWGDVHDPGAAMMGGVGGHAG